MSEQMQDGLTSYERSVAAERTLCDAILDAIETRMSYNLAPRGIYDAEYALQEATDWIELIVKRQIHATQITLWRSRIQPARERSRDLRMAARAAAAVTTQKGSAEPISTESQED